MGLAKMDSHNAIQFPCRCVPVEMGFRRRHELRRWRETPAVERLRQVGKGKKTRRLVFTVRKIYFVIVNNFVIVS